MILQKVIYFLTVLVQFFHNPPTVFPIFYLCFVFWFKSLGTGPMDQVQVNVVTAQVI